MKTRILLKDIPGQKFHSAIFTSYSFNFYYLEQQVLPMLSSKGINYISLLVDSNMLDSQLQNFGEFSELNRRSYSLYGIHSEHSFHPKIIYLVGDKDILILVGSGNLTTCGHGKNLETWNPLFINIEDNTKKAFAKYIWDYINSLFNDLGSNAKQKLRNIEEHSPIFSDVLKTEAISNISISEFETLHFLYPKEKESIYHQLRIIIGEDVITNIVFMSPFYDEKGSLIEQFNKDFSPVEINIILQDNFGKKPSKLIPKPNIKFFRWADINGDNIKQKYFHSKNIVLIGKNYQFLISGSTNASFAAFGNSAMSKLNEEASFLYQSTTANFLELLELDFSSEPIQLKDINEDHITSTGETTEPNSIKIISLEKLEKNLKIVYHSDVIYSGIKMLLHASKSHKFLLNIEKIEKGLNELNIIIDQQHQSFFGHFLYNGKKVSNNQFIIDLVVSEKSNPSKQNRTIFKFRADLDEKFLSSTRIIEYLNTLQKYKVPKLKQSPAATNDSAKNGNVLDEEIMYLSYEELQERVKDFSNTFDNTKHPINHHSNNIWDIISSHLKTSNKKREQKKHDHEETEDVDKSSGSELADKEVELAKVKVKKFEQNQKKIISTFNKYIEVLRKKIETKNIDKPQVNDLSMYLLNIELLIRLVEYKEHVEQEDNSKQEKYLLNQKFSHKGISLSQFIIEIIGLFTIWVHRAKGYEQFENLDYAHRLKLYNEEAFKASFVLISLFNFINEGYKDDILDYWSKLSLLNINSCFNSNNTKYETVEPFDYLINGYTYDLIGEETIHENLLASMSFLNNFRYSKENRENSFFKHPEDGNCLIVHLTENDKTGVFLKLINNGYEWSSELKNYWNQKLYGLKYMKWYSTR